MDTPVFTQIAAIQDECRAESPKAARAIILAHYPSLSENFVKRQLVNILALSPDDLVRLIGHPDPTGEKAVRNIMDAEAARAERELVVA